MNARNKQMGNQQPPTLTKVLSHPELMPHMFIQLPKPLLSRQTQPHQPPPSLVKAYQIHNNLKIDENQYYSSARTQSNSSHSTLTHPSSFGLYNNQRDILVERATKKIAKRNLLGPHWENNLAARRQHILRQSFLLIKEQFHSKNILLIQSRHPIKNKKAEQNMRQGLNIMMGLVNGVMAARKSQWLQRVKLARNNKRSVIFNSHLRKMPQQSVKLLSKSQDYFNHSPSKQKQSSNYQRTLNTIGLPNSSYQVNTQDTLRRTASIKNVPIISNQYAMPLAHFKTSSPANTHQRENSYRNDQINMKKEVYQSSTSIRGLDGGHEKVEPIFLQEGRQSKGIAVTTPSRLHSLSTKKRPVSASLTLKMSCHVVNQSHLQQQSLARSQNCINTRYLRKSMQESFLRVNAHSERLSPSPRHSQQLTQPTSSHTQMLTSHNHQTQYSQQWQEKQRKPKQAPHFKMPVRIPQNDYNLQHRLAPPQLRSICPPRMLPL